MGRRSCAPIYLFVGWVAHSFRPRAAIAARLVITNRGPGTHPLRGTRSNTQQTESPTCLRSVADFFSLSDSPGLTNKSSIFYKIRSFLPFWGIDSAALSV